MSLQASPNTSVMITPPRTAAAKLWTWMPGTSQASKTSSSPCEGKNEKPENPLYHAIHDRLPPRGRGKIELWRGEELVDIVEAALSSTIALGEAAFFST